jgi:hypothetical protein
VTRYNALESHRGGPEEESSFLVNGLFSWSDAEFLYEAKHSLRPAKSHISSRAISCVNVGQSILRQRLTPSHTKAVDACILAGCRKGSGLIFPHQDKERAVREGGHARQRKRTHRRCTESELEFSFLVERSSPWKWFSLR